jgi:hypothetical protein
MQQKNEEANYRRQQWYIAATMITIDNIIKC